MERRLAAILVADVVGYSRLMEADEAGTLAALKSHRDELINPAVAEYNGRIVKLMGDGALIEFASVVDAVVCALAIQDGMTLRNEGELEDRRIEFRVGVHLGDVLVEGDDLYGDGVNVAARLEGLAVPGGICISQQAYDQIETKLDIAYEELGAQRVKNIARPLRAYRVRRDDEASAVPESAEERIDRLLKDTVKEPPLPDGPSVAVLPFESKGDDGDQSFFAEGLTENIIGGLTRFRELLVIGVKSMLIARDCAVDLREIGRALGVAHIVEGSVRRSGERVRVSAHLVEAATGRRLWAETYDREFGDVFVIQDEITNVIVATLAGQIEHAELHRKLTKPEEDLAAYECLLRGRQCLNRYSRDGEIEARRHFERALEREPDYAAALAGLAISYLREYEASWCETPEAALQHCYELAQKAVALDEADGSARYAMASACFYRGQHELAKVHIERALELNPNDYHHICSLGWFLAFSQRPSDAVECSIQALRLNPLTPDNCLFNIGMAEYVGKRYEDALAAFGKMRGWGLLRPAWIAACYAQLGREEQARAAAAEVRALAPTDPSVPDEQDIEHWRNYWSRLIRFEVPDDRERFFDGLRKAGLPA